METLQEKIDRAEVVAKETEKEIEKQVELIEKIERVTGEIIKHNIRIQEHQKKIADDLEAIMNDCDHLREVIPPLRAKLYSQVLRERKEKKGQNNG